MINPEAYEFAEEFYVVEKTVEIVVPMGGQSETIRIEALYAPGPDKYSTRAFRQENVTIQPTYPQTSGEFDREPVDVELWIDFNLPWTDGHTADDVVTQALFFLSEDCA